jgi:hypothetical protein
MWGRLRCPKGECYDLGMSSLSVSPNSQKRMPPPWLAPAIALVAVVSVNAWQFVNAHNAGKPEVGAAIMAGFWVTFLLSLVLIYVTWLNIRDIGREKRMREVLNCERKEHTENIRAAVAVGLREFQKELSITQYSLFVAGKLDLLLEDALRIRATLEKLFRDNSVAVDQADLKYPMTERTLSKYVHLRSAADRLRAHCEHVNDLSLPDFSSGLLDMPIPNRSDRELDDESILALLTHHRRAMLTRYNSLTKPYHSIKQRVDVDPRLT